MENKTKQIEKPISVAIEETKQQIAKVINNSQLSPVVLDLILKDIYNEVHNVYTNQALQEKQQYDASMQQKAEMNDKNDTKSTEEQGD